MKIVFICKNKPSITLCYYILTPTFEKSKAADAALRVRVCPLCALSFSIESPNKIDYIIYGNYG